MKMNPERARELRDKLKPRPAELALRPGSRQLRTIRFDNAWPNQAQVAHLLLQGIERLGVSLDSRPNTLIVNYQVTDYTLHNIEAALINQGFHLDNSFFTRLSRAIKYFSEETELRNLSVPERLVKKSNEIYSKAWEHHPHGDHDDTPADLREER